MHFWKEGPEKLQKLYQLSSVFCLFWFVFSNFDFNLCMVIQLVFPYLLLWNKKAIHVALVKPELKTQSSFNQSAVSHHILIHSH